MNRERVETWMFYTLLFAFIGMAFLATDRLKVIETLESRIRVLNSTIIETDAAIVRLRDAGIEAAKK